jgi:hypothetical protein
MIARPQRPVGVVSESTDSERRIDLHACLMLAGWTLTARGCEHNQPGRVASDVARFFLLSATQ